MKHRFWLVVLLVMALLTVFSSVAFAGGAQGWAGDKIVVGQNYVLPAGQQLDGDLAVIGGSATLEQGSVVTGDVAVLGGNLTMDGTVQGSVAVFGGTASLNDSAVIEGDLATFGGSVQRAPGAVIQGGVFGGPSLPRVPRVPEVPELPRTPEWPGVVSPHAGPFGMIRDVLLWQLSALGWGLFLALLGVIAVVVAPKALGRIAGAAADEPLLSLGMGLLTLVVAALAGALLLLACGLGLLVWLVTWLAFIVGWIAVGLWIGQRILRALKVHNASSLAEVALGVFLITILARMPWCIGFFLAVIAGSVGLGAVVLTRFGTQPAEGSSRPTGDAGSGGVSPEELLPVVAEPEPVVDVGAGDEAEEEVKSELEPSEVKDAPGFVGEIPVERVLALEDLTVIAGIGPQFAERLRTAGVKTLADLAATTPEKLGPMIGVPVERIVRDDWVGQAQKLLG